MHYKIKFKNLPFVPDAKQAIFIENIYDETINRFISDNHERLVDMFADMDLSFVYLPKLYDTKDIEAKIRYYAPYLSSDITYNELPQSCMLLGCMANPENRNKIEPSIIIFDEQDDDGYIFDGWTVDADSNLMERFDDISLYIIHRHSSLSEDKVLFCEGDDEEESKSSGSLACEPIPCVGLDGEQPIEELLDELQSTVKRLQLKGVTLAAIHELIDKHEQLSKLYITDDYRIFLPDYNNVEIVMGELPKALFFTFLNHQEGIVLREITEYRSELLNIYSQFKPRHKIQILQHTIDRVTDPSGNAIHENIARIRAAFVSKFDEHLAQNYFVTGKKGETYSIKLDRKLVEWEY